MHRIGFLRTRTQRSGTRARTRKEFVAKELGCGNTQNFNRVLVFIVLGATFFAYLFTVYGLQHLSASAAGAFIYLQPLFSSLFS
ncbi:MAG: EamA family transporter, partial [Planctomycetota bacterium]